MFDVAAHGNRLSRGANRGQVVSNQSGGRPPERRPCPRRATSERGDLMRIAMISEHASPLALLGGVDAGGQNQHVAELSTALARDGPEVRVYTRRHDPPFAAEGPLRPGGTGEHVPPGPAAPVPQDELLP